jgi:hypothetical protein
MFYPVDLNFNIKLCQKTGRSGYSGTKCPFCIASQKDIRKGAGCRALTEDDLKGNHKEEFGYKMPCIWNLPMSSYIFAVLHNQLGLVNNVYVHMVNFIMTEVDNAATEEELLFRKEILELSKELGTDSELGGVSQFEATEIVALLERKEITDKLASLRRDRKNSKDRFRRSKASERAQRKITTTEAIAKGTEDYVKAMALDQEVSDLDEAILAGVARLKNIRASINSLRDDDKMKKQRCTELKARVKKLYNKRLKMSSSIDTILEVIISSFGVVIQAFHGGAMQGNACKRLVEQIDDVMEKLIPLCAERLNQRRQIAFANAECDAISNEQMVTQLGKYRELFIVLDESYSLLRTVAPTEEELLRTEQVIKIEEKLWNEFDLSITPKVHMKFQHAAQQQRMWDGFGDKSDDTIEVFHQVQNDVAYLTKRMASGTEAQLRSQQKTIWKWGDPETKWIVEDARKSRMRNSSNRGQHNTLQEQNEEARRKPRLEKRKAVMKKLLNEAPN